MASGYPLQVRLEKDEVDAIDRYRRTQDNPPSRARAVRELIHLALTKESNGLRAVNEAKGTSLAA